MHYDKKERKKRRFKRDCLFLGITMLLFIGVFSLCFAKLGSHASKEAIAATENTSVVASEEVEPLTESTTLCTTITTTSPTTTEAATTMITTTEPTEVAIRKSKRVYKEADGSKKVYLTFDDGPCPNTPKLLDALDRCNAKATFFVTGQFLRGQRLVDQIKEISDRGHAVAVHSYTHEFSSIYSSPEAYIEDFNKMNDVIYQALGKRSTIFRFPGGSNAYPNRNIRSELINKVNDLGLTYYDWNAYDGDCDGFRGDSLINKAVEECSCTNRSILLMHDMMNKSFVIDAIEEIVDSLRAEGYTFPVIDESVEPIQFV